MCSCSLCGKPLKNYDKYYLCDYCKSELSFHEKPNVLFDEICSSMLSKIANKNCLYSIISVCLYEGTAREMVHKLKYNGKVQIASTMAAYISDEIQKSGISFDVIVPVPSHAKRMKKRGYNQAALIAEKLSDITSVPCSQMLCKIKNTKSQVLLNSEDRWYNVMDAFALSSDIQRTNPVGLRILLVDDIITTGATVYHCSCVLRKNGAAEVTAVSFARTF